MGIAAFIAGLGERLLGSIGYGGLFLLMVAESMVLPVPSEAVLPFAGFLVAKGAFSLWGVILVSTLGSLVGSLLSYGLGRFGGRRFVARFCRYLLLNEEDLERTDRFFRRWGVTAILAARFIPVVRHLISILAGLAGLSFLHFSLFTIAGTGLWNAFLTGCGLLLREHWKTALRYGHIVDIVVMAVLLGLVALFFVRHLRRRNPKIIACRRRAGRRS
jgi:membrane protein DedA with SNARE-associated domain